MNNYPQINQDIIKLVKKYAVGLHKSFNLLIDIEDFEQELLMELLISLDKFDVKRGKLTSFVNRCLFTKAAGIHRKLMQNKRKTFLYTSPLYENMSQDVCDNTSFINVKGVRNLKNISCVETFSVRELSKLGETDLHDLSIKINEAFKWIKSLVEKFEQALATKYDEEAKKKLNENGADFGTCALKKGKFVVNIQMPKKVQWDQDILAKIYETTDPEMRKIFKLSYNIHEKDYAKLPGNMLELINPARMTTHGKVKIILSKEDETNENN